MKKMVKILVLLACCGGGGAVWLRTSPLEDPELTLYGNVDYRQVELTFLDAERIEAVLAEEGMEVQPGQVLARLETRRLRDKIAVAEAQAQTAEVALARLRNGTRPEEIDQARAAVASAKAERVFAEAQYRRVDSLWKDSAGKSVRRQDVDDALRQLNVARARLNQEEKGLRLAELGPRAEDIAEAEARLLESARNLDQLRNQLGDADLKSPVRATVSRRLMEAGDMASPQKTVFSLAVPSPKWVRAYVPETILTRLRPGMAATIHTDGRPDQAFPGTLGFLSSVAEFTPKTVQTPDLRTSLVYEIRVSVDDPDDILRLGMPATLRFPELSR